MSDQAVPSLSSRRAYRADATVAAPRELPLACLACRGPCSTDSGTESLTGAGTVPPLYSTARSGGGTPGFGHLPFWWRLLDALGDVF